MNTTMLTGPAFAEPGGPVLSLTLNQVTGTGPFEGDNDPGHDSGPDNDVIRTNDTVTYNLGIRFEGGTHTGTTVEFPLPRGQELVNLPPYCIDGSNVTPESLPDPAVPLTADSWEDLPRQTVTCVLADHNSGEALNFKFVTSVRPEVPNGTRLDPVEFSVHSTEAPEPVTVANDPLTVSAKAVFDLSKNYKNTDNRGPVAQGSGKCPATSPERSCFMSWYSVTIDVPTGGKGTAPLADGISFVEDISPEHFYGADVWSKAIDLAGSEQAAIEKYAPRMTCLGNPGLHGTSGGYLPFPRIGFDTGSTAQNSVRDSGDVTCSPNGSLGDPVTVTFTGTDTSAFTTPTAAARGASLPADSGTIVSKELGIGVPIAAVADLGLTNGNSMTLNTHNAYTDVQMTDLGGNPVADADPSNNTRDLTKRLQVSGRADKWFSGIWGQPGNTPEDDWDSPGGFSDTQGPPGSGLRKDGNTVVAPGEAIQSVMSFGENGAAGTGTDLSRTIVGCDVWDPSRLMLAGDPDWKGSRPDTGSNGDPVWIISYRGANQSFLNTSDVNTANGLFDGLTIEYSSGAFGPGEDADCSTGDWSTNPDDVAGVTKTVDDQGRTTWDGINRVRVRFNTQWPASIPQSQSYLKLAIGQIVKATGRTDEPIGNWFSNDYRGGIHTAAETMADPDSEHLPTYDEKTHVGDLGDRVFEGTASVRVHKYVQNPDTGDFTDTTVPLFTGGDTATYRLNPSLTGNTPEGTVSYPVTIEDCLPQYELFESSTRQDGSEIDPMVVQMGAPDNAEITCADTQQYVKWNLGEYGVGEVIDPLLVNAEILDVARNGTYTNTTVVASPADPSPVSARTDDVQLQLVAPTGIQISKTVDKQLIEVNPVGVQTPRTLTWSVFFANIDNPTDVGNVDVIDVLPSDGIAGSEFTGQLRFDEATVAAGDGMTILYTKTPSTDLAVDPRDTSNAQADGSTVWCDAPAGGAATYGSGSDADCPADASEVTGIRIIRPGTFDPADEFQIDIQTTPVGNYAGDVYLNRTSGMVDGVTQSVGPARRQAQVISSQVGDLVWDDDNANGIQDDGEAGIPDWPVELVGTDLDGNPVDLTTTTDADGKYLFDNLASGTYKVIFDPANLGAGSAFSSPLANGGDSPEKDSDADPKTGETPEFRLGPDATDTSWDAGVVSPGEWTLSKTSDPESGSVVKPGDTITYTLTAANDSNKGVDDVVVADDLSDVLDDATFGSFSNDDDGNATRSDNTVIWNVGTLAAGETRTASYTVTVNDDAYEATLKNIASGKGEFPPSDCTPDEPCTTEQTTSPKGEWTLSKTSDPESGSVVEPGDTITYTLTAANPSKGDVSDVVVSDDLSDVLDDASFGLFTNDDGNVARSGNTLTWNVGTLAAGETRTVSYTVTVNDDAYEATLKNIASGEGEFPPSDCTPDEPCTTEQTTPPKPHRPGNPGEQGGGNPPPDSGGSGIPGEQEGGNPPPDSGGSGIPGEQEGGNPPPNSGGPSSPNTSDSSGSADTPVAVGDSGGTGSGPEGTLSYTGTWVSPNTMIGAGLIIVVGVGLLLLGRRHKNKITGQSPN